MRTHVIALAVAALIMLLPLAGAMRTCSPTSRVKV